MNEKALKEHLFQHSSYKDKVNFDSDAPLSECWLDKLNSKFCTKFKYCYTGVGYHTKNKAKSHLTIFYVSDRNLKQIIVQVHHCNSA